LVQAGPSSMREALKELKERRGPFMIFIDEFIKDRVQAPAFGRRLRIEGNIAFAIRLAVKTGAVLIPAYCVRDGDRARFKMTYLPPFELVQGGDRDADLAENVRRLDALIAPIIAKYADQWFYALDFEFDADAPAH
jgi:KDO2-lipid IV(A) lauroyltransferase